MRENKTGTAWAPRRAQSMVDAPSELWTPTSSRYSGNGRGNGHSEVSEIRSAFAREGGPLGSVGRGGSESEPLSEELIPLIDKLGARLAFERMSTRLYGALLDKLDIYGSFVGGPTGVALGEMLVDKQAHFQLLYTAIASLGGDPTSVTPAAALEMTIARGISDAIGDPRTTLIDGLNAMLVAEIADQEHWESLLDQVGLSGRVELNEEMRAALENQDEHVERLRFWLQAARQLPM